MAHNRPRGSGSKAPGNVITGAFVTKGRRRLPKQAAQAAWILALKTDEVTRFRRIAYAQLRSLTARKSHLVARHRLGYEVADDLGNVEADIKLLHECLRRIDAIL